MQPAHNKHHAKSATKGSHTNPSPIPNTTSSIIISLAEQRTHLPLKTAQHVVNRLIKSRKKNQKKYTRAYLSAKQTKKFVKCQATCYTNPQQSPAHHPTPSISLKKLQPCVCGYLFFRVGKTIFAQEMRQKKKAKEKEKNLEARVLLSQRRRVLAHTDPRASKIHCVQVLMMMTNRGDSSLH
jgi:hypothetical protein